MKYPDHVSKFIDRWNIKRNRYGTATLEDCFDRFFTSYVIYNFLYGWITRSEGYNFKKDYHMATKVPKKYLGEDILFGNQILQQETATIAKLLRSKQFTLKNSKEDEKILEKIESKDPAQWSIAMMQAVYIVRCNTFHGEKGFERNQLNILKPSIVIIENVTSLMLNKPND